MKPPPVIVEHSSSLSLFPSFPVFYLLRESYLPHRTFLPSTFAGSAVEIVVHTVSSDVERCRKRHLTIVALRPKQQDLSIAVADLRLLSTGGSSRSSRTTGEKCGQLLDVLFRSNFNSSSSTGKNGRTRQENKKQ